MDRSSKEKELGGKARRLRSVSLTKLGPFEDIVSEKVDSHNECLSDRTTGTQEKGISKRAKPHTPSRLTPKKESEKDREEEKKGKDRSESVERSQIRDSRNRERDRDRERGDRDRDRSREKHREVERDEREGISSRGKLKGDKDKKENGNNETEKRERNKNADRERRGSSHSKSSSSEGKRNREKTGDKERDHAEKRSKEKSNSKEKEIPEKANCAGPQERPHAATEDEKPNRDQELLEIETSDIGESSFPNQDSNMPMDSSPDNLILPHPLFLSSDVLSSSVSPDDDEKEIDNEFAELHRKLLREKLRKRAAVVKKQEAEAVLTGVNNTVEPPKAPNSLTAALKRKGMNKALRGQEFKTEQEQEQASISEQTIEQGYEDIKKIESKTVENSVVLEASFKLYSDKPIVQKQRRRSLPLKEEEEAKENLMFLSYDDSSFVNGPADSQGQRPTIRGTLRCRTVTPVAGSSLPLNTSVGSSSQPSVSEI